MRTVHDVTFEQVEKYADAMSFNNEGEQNFKENRQALFELQSQKDNKRLYELVDTDDDLAGHIWSYLEPKQFEELYQGYCENELGEIHADEFANFLEEMGIEAERVYVNYVYPS